MFTVSCLSRQNRSNSQDVQAPCRMLVPNIDSSHCIIIVSSISSRLSYSYSVTHSLWRKGLHTFHRDSAYSACLAVLLQKEVN